MDERSADGATEEPLEALLDALARALGVVTDDGKVKSDKADKYRQVQHLIKILDERVAASELPARARPRIVDIGSGKGYLTFALHDYFRNYLGLEAEVLGVDRNREL